MFAEYESGRTPNPDVLCNREIKFDVFMKTAMDLGADYVATGHYCRKGETQSGEFQLLAGKDDNKDQSYFLCQLTQEQLSKSLFPIRKMKKSRVREIAKEENISINEFVRRALGTEVYFLEQKKKGSKVLLEDQKHKLREVVFR